MEVIELTISTVFSELLEMLQNLFFFVLSMFM